VVPVHNSKADFALQGRKSADVAEADVANVVAVAEAEAVRAAHLVVAHHRIDHPKIRKI
jgi:hypothetical protein